MSWKKVEVSTPISNEVANIVSSVSTVTSTLSTLFTAVTTLLEIAKVFVTGTIEPFQALTNAIVGELESLINDLFATGFYVLTVNPFELTNSAGLIEINKQRKLLNDEEDVAIAQFKAEEKVLQREMFNANPSQQVLLTKQIQAIDERRTLKRNSLNNQREILELERADYGFDSFGIPILTPKDCINIAVDSLDDLGDGARPIFSDNAQISAIGFMATAPGLDQFKQIMEDFINAFKIPDWEIALFRFKEVSTVTPTSVPPDWKSMRLNSFSPMDQLQRTLIGVLETVKGFEVTASGNIQDLIDIMSARAEQLDKVSNNLEALANSIQSATGLFVLNVPLGTGGNTRLKNELRDAYLECQKNNYTIMTVFVGGGPSAQSIDVLRGLFLG